MKQFIYDSLLVKKKKGQKSFAVLIDPDNVNGEKIDEFLPSVFSMLWPVRREKSGSLLDHDLLHTLPAALQRHAFLP